MIDRKRTALPDWTDLQFLVELARQGSLSAAARALGVTHATVARRIAALDATFGRPLFVRQAGRYMLTGVGSQIAALAVEMEEPALRVARAMAGVMPEIAGPVRITATDLIAPELVSPAIAELRADHPGLDLELIVSSENLSLARRDVDIALRLARPMQGDLFTRKVGELGFYRYASRAYLKNRRGSSLEYIGYCNVSPDYPEVRALESICGSGQIVMRTNHLSSRFAAVLNGVGVALLPKLSAGARKELQALDRVPVVKRELWLIVHRDLRDVPRIRTCVEHLGKSIQRQRKRMI
jgi:DNA-binding transcriptional LysR family regulator